MDTNRPEEQRTPGPRYEAAKGITEADMWLRLAESLLPAYDQPPPSEATIDQPAATPSDVMALVGVRAWAEYEANTDADDAVICPPTRTLLALLEVRPPASRAICTGPLANLELPTVEQLAEAIAATISQRINTPPELQHAQWLTDTMTTAGVEMYLHHPEPTLMRVGDDNLCAISLGKEDEDFADTLRLTVALTSHACRATAGAIAPAATAMPGAHADDEEELELNYEENDSAMEVDTTQGAAAETPGKTSTTSKIKKKQPRGRSRSDGATRNRSRSKPRLSGTHSSDSEWITDDDASHPSNSPH
eukprot:jgi/Tetstr1/430939/TSEL_020695.t1